MVGSSHERIQDKDRSGQSVRFIRTQTDGSIKLDRFRNGVGDRCDSLSVGPGLIEERHLFHVAG
jgi:hypothetical protein